MLRHSVPGMSGGTQRRAMPRPQYEELKLQLSLNNSYPRQEINPTTSRGTKCDCKTDWL